MALTQASVSSYFPLKCFLLLNSLVFVSLQDGEGTPLDVQVKDNGNGTYTCTYTPRKPLKHTVMVSWGGVNIPDSPFRVSTHTYIQREFAFPGVSTKIFFLQKRLFCFCALTTDEYWGRLSSKQGEGIRTWGGQDRPESLRANILHCRLLRGWSR